MGKLSERPCGCVARIEIGFFSASSSSGQLLEFMIGMKTRRAPPGRRDLMAAEFRWKIGAGRLPDFATPAGRNAQRDGLHVRRLAVISADIASPRVAP